MIELPICTPAELRERHRVMGPARKEFGPDVIADYQYVFEALRREDEQAEADGRAIPEDAIIHVPPEFFFAHSNDHAPVVAALRRIAGSKKPISAEDAATLRWTAGEIEKTRKEEHGGFAFRKSAKQKIEDMGEVYDPWAHLPDIQRLLLQRGHPRRGVIERSVWLAALHWNFSFDEIHRIVRRSDKDRRDPPRFT
jgi:hypothetical protein